MNRIALALLASFVVLGSAGLASADVAPPQRSVLERVLPQEEVELTTDAAPLDLTTLPTEGSEQAYNPTPRTTAPSLITILGF